MSRQVRAGWAAKSMASERDEMPLWVAHGRLWGGKRPGMSSISLSPSQSNYSNSLTRRAKSRNQIPRMGCIQVRDPKSVGYLSSVPLSQEGPAGTRRIKAEAFSDRLLVRIHRRTRVPAQMMDALFS